MQANDAHVHTASAVTPAMVAAATISTLQSLRGAALAMLQIADDQLAYLRQLIDDTELN